MTEGGLFGSSLRALDHRRSKESSRLAYDVPHGLRNKSWIFEMLSSPSFNQQMLRKLLLDEEGPQIAKLPSTRCGEHKQLYDRPSDNP